MFPAVIASAIVILSAPFAQQAFSAIEERWPAEASTIVVGATVVPVGLAVLVALWRIRQNRWRRYLLLALGLGVGVTYVRVSQPIFTETFHFLEYGVLAALFYRAWLPRADRSTLILPLLACAIAGTLDEWFQWFIPIRAGEARDVGINVLAAGCGLLFAVGVRPLDEAGAGRRPGAGTRLVAWGAASVLTFAAFVQTVHVGHDVSDPEIGSFRSRYAATALASAARERAERWRSRPPVTQRRLSREDHYLSEGLWHVGRRDQAWEAGDMAMAWRENRILELFYAPILTTPTYADAAGHGWPAAQREAASAAAASGSRPYASDAYPYPLLVWPAIF